MKFGLSVASVGLLFAAQAQAAGTVFAEPDFLPTELGLKWKGKHNVGTTGSEVSVKQKNELRLSYMASDEIKLEVRPRPVLTFAPDFDADFADTQVSVSDSSIYSSGDFNVEAKAFAELAFRDGKALSPGGFFWLSQSLGKLELVAMPYALYNIYYSSAAADWTIGLLPGAYYHFNPDLDAYFEYTLEGNGTVSDGTGLIDSDNLEVGTYVSLSEGWQLNPYFSTPLIRNIGDAAGRSVTLTLIATLF